MKITGRQLQVALDALRGSLGIADGGSRWTFDAETRRTVYAKIINQQGDTLIDVADDDKENS